MRVTCAGGEEEEEVALSTPNIADPADTKDAGQVSPGPQWPSGCRMKSTLRRSPCK